MRADQDRIHAWVLGAKLVEGVAVEPESFGGVQAVDRGIAWRGAITASSPKKSPAPEHGISA